MSSYRKKVLEARKKVLNLTTEQLKQIDEIYSKSATRLIDGILDLPDISRTRVHDIDIARLLNDYTKDLYKQLYPNVTENMMKSSIMQRQVILDFVDQVAKDRTLSKIVKNNINKYSNSVVKTLIAGEYYKDGKTLSKRLWNITKENGNKIDEFIKMNIASGANAKKLANDLEILINPKNKIVTNNFKAGFNSYKVSYQAQRLARTSITHAATETQIQNAKKNPFDKGLRWNLSASHGTRMHGKQDECDDREGKVYKPDKTPLQHCNCMCYFTEEVTSIDDAIARINNWVDGEEDKELDTWCEGFDRTKKEDSKTIKQPVKVNGKDGTMNVKAPEKNIEVKQKDNNNFRKIDKCDDISRLNEVGTNILKDKNIQVVYENTNLHVAKEELKQFINLKEQYNTDKIYSVGSTSFNKIGLDGKFIRMANDTGGILQTKNVKHFIEPNNYERMIEKQKKWGDKPYNVNVDAKNANVSTLTHEFGHSFGDYQQRKLSPEKNEFWKEMRNIYKDYKKEIETGKFDNFISQYAGTKIDEFMAEAFTEAKLSSNPSKYSIKVLDTIDKHFKRDIIDSKIRFNSAKTIKEAEKYSIDNLGFNKVNFNGIDVNVANRINKTLMNSYEEYPLLKGFIKEIKVCKNGAPASAEMTYKNGELKTLLKLSKVDLNNIDDIDNMIKECVEIKWWTPKESIDGIVKHELGHMIEYASTMKKYGMNFESTDNVLIGKVFEAIKNGEFSKEIKKEALENIGLLDNKKVIIDNLSEYATKNTKEFLAEAISEKNPRELSQEVVKILKEKIEVIFND